MIPEQISQETSVIPVTTVTAVLIFDLNMEDLSEFLFLSLAFTKQLIGYLNGNNRSTIAVQVRLESWQKMIEPAGHKVHKF